MESGPGAEAEILALTQALVDAQDGPERARLLNLRGCAHYRAGSRVEAEADFEAAYAADPDCAEALNNRACLRAESGDLARAQIDLTRALALQPQLDAARVNHRLVGGVRGLDRPLARTTLSQLDGGSPGAFCQALMGFLEARISAPPGFEDCREDAISEVVTRVLAHSQERDLPLADALRDLRRSSTRGWVRRLMSRLRQRGGRDPDELAATAQAPTAPALQPAQLLRLADTLNEVRERLLARSRPSTRRRRRVLWGIYLDALSDGIHLSRREAMAAARELGLGLAEVSDRQLERDLELLSAELRAERSGD